jgi:hypothetical protein
VDEQVQYIDFQADNDQVNFIDMLRWMRGQRMLSLIFRFTRVRRHQHSLDNCWSCLPLLPRCCGC